MHEESVALSELKIGDEVGIVSTNGTYHFLAISEVGEKAGLPWVAADDYGRRVTLTLSDTDGRETFFIHPKVNYSITRGALVYNGVIRFFWLNGENIF